MAEQHNGLTRLLRAWPIIATVGCLVIGLVSWQFVGLRTAVNKLQGEHQQAMPLAQQVPALAATLATVEKEQARRTGTVADVNHLRTEIQTLRQELATRTTLLAVVDSRMSNLERELQSIKTIVEDIRRGVGRAPHVPY